MDIEGGMGVECFSPCVVGVVLDSSKGDGGVELLELAQEDWIVHALVWKGFEGREGMSSTVFKSVSWLLGYSARKREGIVGGRYVHGDGTDHPRFFCKFLPSVGTSMADFSKKSQVKNYSRPISHLNISINLRQDKSSSRSLGISRVSDMS